METVFCPRPVVKHDPQATHFHAANFPAGPAPEAEYLYELTDDRLVLIIDLDGDAVPSVTNDIRAVLADVAAREGLPHLGGCRVAYLDSEGDWCRVLLDDSGHVEQICGFGHRVSCEAEARHLLRTQVA